MASRKKTTKKTKSKKESVKKVLIVYDKEEWEEDAPQCADVFEDVDSAMERSAGNGAADCRYFEVEVVSEIKPKREYTIVRV